MRGALLLLLVAGCHGASSDPGSGALFLIPDAQFVPGPLPFESGGPEVVSVMTTHSSIIPGSRGERFEGALGIGTTGAVLGIPGDIGHWVLTAGAPDVDTPDFPSFDVRASFAQGLVPGPFEVQVHAVDPAGRVGPAYGVALTAQAAADLGLLVFRLTWDLDADVDVRVILPDGIEVWRENRNSYVPPPPGTPEPDPTAPLRGGILDRDSNSQCLIDGRREEAVVWTMPPPSGRYTVRVDTFSMCEQPYANWLLEVFHAGELIGSARGVAREADTRLPHGPGAGLFALEVELP